MIIGIIGIAMNSGAVFAQQQTGQEQKKTGLGAALQAWLSGEAQTESWKQQSGAVPLPVSTDTSIPEIRKLWPNRGGGGQYITVEGINFGIKPGEVAFGKIGVSVKGDTNFPGECGKTWWQSNYAVVKVPALSAGRYKIRLKRADGKVSKEVSFQITNASPSPGVCGIVPDNGPLGIPLKIYGANFGKQKGKVVIGSLEAQTPDTWERNIITTVTPVGDFSLGKVKVINASRSISNLIPFSVGQCTNTSCGEGKSCCSDGSCRLKGTCEEKIPLSIYEWTFYTGSLLKMGESCLFNEQCLSGVCIEGKCAEGLGEEGSVCKTDAQCKKPLVCIEGICKTALARLGEKCGTNTQCASGNCVNGVCAEGKKKDGEACKNNQECASQNCYNGICGQSKQCLKVESIEPSGKNFKKNSSITATFNQLIDEQSFKNGFSLEPSVKGTFDFRKIPSGKTVKTQAAFLPSDALSEKIAYTIKLADFIKAATSNEILGKCSTDVVNKKECSGSGDICKNSSSTCVNGATCKGGGSICSGTGTTCEGKGDRCIHGATCTGDGGSCIGEGTTCKGIGSECTDNATCPPPIVDEQSCDTKCNICKGNASSCFNGAVCFGAKARCSGEGTVCGGAETVCSNGAMCTGAQAVCNGEKTICTGKYARCTDGAICGTQDFCQDKGRVCDAPGAVCTNGAQCVGAVALCSGKGTVCTGIGSKCYDGALCRGTGSLCLKNGTQCTGAGAECREGAECLGTDSHCNDKGSVCKGDYSKCENDATCSGRAPIYSGSEKTCNGTISSCIAIGSICSNGSACKSIESICSGEGTVCSGNEAQCSGGALCEGAKAFCTGTGTICRGASSQCASGALCAGVESMCTGNETRCSGRDSVCTNSADCNPQDSSVSADKIVENMCSGLGICPASGVCPDGKPCTPGTNSCEGQNICPASGKCPDGRPCTPGTNSCGSGLGICPASGKCPDGRPCTPGTNSCGSGLGICPASGVCPDGKPCTPGTNSCEGQNICPASGKCPDGRPCTPGTNSCGSGLGICPASGKCPDGRPCTPGTNSCGSGLGICPASGVCPDGKPCTPGTNSCELLCPPGKVKCANGCFDPGDKECIPLSCNNNKICDANESCNCADCYDQQDKCEAGLVCRELTKDCRYKNCKMESATESGAQCSDGKDNDCDGVMDGADDTNCFDPSKCPPGKVKCANGCFDSVDDPACIHLSCNNNKICETGESCDCPDCYDQQDSCRAGEVCRELTQDCRIKNCKMESATESGVQCFDGKDNDCDGKIDSADDDCKIIQCPPESNCPSHMKCDFDAKICRLKCTSDADCPTGTRCNKQVNMCVPIIPCENDKDCPAGQVCIEKICKEREIIKCNADGSCPAGYEKDPNSTLQNCLCKFKGASQLTYVSILVNKKQTENDAFDCWSASSQEICVGDQDIVQLGTQHTYEIELLDQYREPYSVSDEHIVWNIDATTPTPFKLSLQIGRSIVITNTQSDGNAKVIGEVTIGTEKRSASISISNKIRKDQRGDPKILDEVVMYVDGNKINPDSFSCAGDTCQGDADGLTKGNQHMYSVVAYAQNNSVFSADNIDSIVWSLDKDSVVKLSSTLSESIFGTNTENSGVATLTAKVTPKNGFAKSVSVTIINSITKRCNGGVCTDILPTSRIGSIKIFTNKKDILKDSFGCVKNFCDDDAQLDSAHPGNQHAYTVKVYDTKEKEMSISDADIEWTLSGQKEILTLSRLFSSEVFGTNSFTEGFATLTVVIHNGNEVKTASIGIENKGPFLVCEKKDGVCTTDQDTEGNPNKLKEIIIYIDGSPLSLDSFYCTGDACVDDKNTIQKGNQHNYTAEVFAQNNSRYDSKKIAHISWKMIGPDVVTLDTSSGPEVQGTNTSVEDTASLVATVETKDGQKTSSNILIQNELRITSNSLKAPNDLIIKELYSQKIVLSWKNNEPTAEGVAIERRFYGGEYTLLTKLTGSDKNIYSDEADILDNTYYSYRVRAYKASAVSDYSNMKEAWTPRIILSTPKNATAKILDGNKKVQLSWNAADEGQDGFDIERQEWGADFLSIGRAKTLERTFTDSSIQPLGMYAYRIRSYKGELTSDYVYPARVSIPNNPQTGASIEKLRLYINGVASLKDSFSKLNELHSYSVIAYDKDNNEISFGKNITVTIMEGSDSIAVQNPVTSGTFTVWTKKMTDQLVIAKLQVKVTGVNKEERVLDIPLSLRAGQAPSQNLITSDETQKEIKAPCTTGTTDWEYMDDDFDFGSSYCASGENQLTDNPIIITSDPEALRVYFFQFRDPTAKDNQTKPDPNNTDVIVVRVFRPSDTDIAKHYYSFPAWFESQKKFVGASVLTTIDGYESFKGPAGTYVGSFVAQPQENSGYYVLHITTNANPKSGTIVALNKFISGMTLSKSIIRKTELQRDLVRLLDLKQINDLLQDYKISAPCITDITKPCYPSLEGGSYIRGQTISGFPSWNATLGNTLGSSLPVDPHPDAQGTPLGVCNAPYNNETCWNEERKEFYYKTKTRVNDVEIALDSPAVHAYTYRFFPGALARIGTDDSYRVCGRLEYFMGNKGKKLCFPASEETIASFLDSVSGASVRGSIRAEYWYNIPGNTVSSFITETPNYPKKPDYETYIQSSQLVATNDTNYGVRISGYVYPPVDGSYTFYVKGENVQAELSLKNRESELIKVPVGKWESLSNNWSLQNSGQSESQKEYTAGEKYYIEAVVKAGTATPNHFEIGWKRPGSTIEIIAGGNLSPYVAKVSQCKTPQVDDGTGKCVDCPIGSVFDNVSDCERCGGEGDAICPTNCMSSSASVQCWQGCRKPFSQRDNKCKVCPPGTVYDNAGGCTSCGDRDQEACPVKDSAGKESGCTLTTIPKCFNGCKEDAMTENKSNICRICDEWSYYKDGTCLSCGAKGQVECNLDKAVQTRQKCQEYLTVRSGKCELCLAGTISDGKGGCRSCGKLGESICPYQ
jgi:hypothetical protein